MFKTFWVTSQYLKDSSCRVDGEHLTLAINRCLAKLDSDGYDLVSITPVISGSYSVKTFDTRYQSIVSGAIGNEFESGVKYTSAPATCASYGYSFTEGVVVVAKKKGN